MPENQKPDMVNRPPHYMTGGIETIDYIEAKLSPEEFIGYLRGSIFKYNTRIGLKGEQQDAEDDSGKIVYYAQRLQKKIKSLNNG